MSPLPTPPPRLVALEDEHEENEPQAEERRTWRDRLGGLRRRESVKPTTQWSDGGSWATRAMTGGVLLAIACGPAALLMDSLRSEAEPLTLQQVQTYDKRQGAREDVAREAATELVSVWAGATTKEHGRLEQIVGDVEDRSLPEKPLELKDVRALSSQPVAPGVWSISVSGLGKVDGTWTRMAWKVPVAVAGGGEEGEAAASAMALPAQVATPAVVAEVPQTGYPVTVTQGPLHRTVDDFLNALLAGGEGLDRVSVPDSTVAAVSPAPYKRVEITELLASEVKQGTDLDSPTEGQVIHVAANVQLHNSGSKDSVGRPGRYYLTLEARAGRWEVAAIDDFPVMQNTNTNTTQE